MGDRRKTKAQLVAELQVLRRRLAESETIGVRRDVAERGQATAALDQQREILENVLARIPHSVFWKDRELVYLGCNENFARDAGLQTPADVVGKTDYDLPWTRAQSDFYRSCDREVIRTGRPRYNIEEPLSLADGRQLTVLTSKTPLRDADGRIVGVLGIYADISEHKRVAEELRQFKTISDRANYGIAIADLAERLTYVNRPFAEMHGCAPEELLGQHLSVLHTPAQMPQVKALNDQLRRVGQYSAQEVWHRRRDGTVFPTLMNATVITDDGGAPLFLSATAIDISRWRQTEAEKARLEEQLYQAQKMQAVGQVAAGIAHDFGSLLAVIRDGVERLQAVSLAGAEAREPLHRVAQAVAEATGTTESLLMFSRKLPAERVPLDLARLVRDAMQFLRHLLPSTVELQVHTAADGSCWVDADAGQLRQVLLNLVLNARDAMPAGGRLEVSVQAEPPDQTAARTFDVRLTVRDSGAGMSAAVRQRAFDPFFTTKDGGTGLGLATVQSIVRDHGGRVAVESEPGRGATFVVSLPGSSVPSTIGPAPAGCGRPILLVEDNQHARRLLAATLRSWGFQVIAMDSEEHACTRFLTQPQAVAAIILSADPLERRGLECLRRIRAAGHRVPIVLTAREFGADAREACDGATVLLSKPFQMTELGVHLSRLLTTPESEGSEP